MRYYSKTRTEVQRAARSTLRLATKGLNGLRCVNRAGLSDEGRRDYDRLCATHTRIIDAFHAARTDTDLLAALALTAQLTQLASVAGKPNS